MQKRSESRAERVQLRDVIKSDLAIFFAEQLDPLAVRMAAFTSANPSDRSAFDRRWGRILDDDEIEKWTVLLGGEIAGHIMCYPQGGGMEVTYWIGREYWGRGVASDALREMLRRVPVRPLFARVAKDNIASLRVLEKCGFRVVNEDKGFAAGRGAVVEEYILRLDAEDA